jgi:polysaccharide export outer membrane protein
VAGAAAQTTAIRPPEAGAQYTLGSGDEITISLSDVAELQDAFDGPFVLDSDGEVSVPMVGRLHAAGLTVLQLQDTIRDGLKKFIRDPQPYVNLKSLKSQPVTVLGAVNTPGVHQISGPKTLAEVLALAGGLSKDAGYRVTVTRQKKWGVVPLPGATWDPTGEFNTAEVSTRTLTDASNAADNIPVKPNDVITVPRADVVYVIGEVHKAGGFTMGDRKSVSVLEALSLAEGVTRTASAGKAKILRTAPGNATRVPEKIDLKKVLSGKAGDVNLGAGDILLVPDNAGKRIGQKTAEMALQTVSGIIIWRGL